MARSYVLVVEIPPHITDIQVDLQNACMLCLIRYLHAYDHLDYTSVRPYVHAHPQLYIRILSLLLSIVISIEREI